MEKTISLVQELPEDILNEMDACKCTCGWFSGAGNGCSCGLYSGSGDKAS